MKKGKGCLTVIGVLIVLGVVGNMLGGGDSKKTDSNPQKQEQNVKTEENTTPEITVSAIDISKAFHENELKGKELYTDKVAEITGTVQSIDEMVGKKFIVLDGDKDNFENIVSVQCYLKEDDGVIKKATEFKKGDQITIIGTIGEKSINVNVNDCIIK